MQCTFLHLYMNNHVHSAPQSKKEDIRKVVRGLSTLIPAITITTMTHTAAIHKLIAPYIYIYIYIYIYTLHQTILSKSVILKDVPELLLPVAEPGSPDPALSE